MFWCTKHTHRFIMQTGSVPQGLPHIDKTWAWPDELPKLLFSQLMLALGHFWIAKLSQIGPHKVSPMSPISTNIKIIFFFLLLVCLQIRASSKILFRTYWDHVVTFYSFFLFLLKSPYYLTPRFHRFNLCSPDTSRFECMKILLEITELCVHAHYIILKIKDVE